MFTSDQKILYLSNQVKLKPLLFQMAIFLHNLTHVPVGFTVAGLFMITKESAITVNITQNNQLL